MSNVLRNGLLDVLFIQESKLDDTFPMSQFYVPGFKLFRNDYKANSGGIMCYIRTELAPQRCTDIETNVVLSGRIESLAISINFNKQTWILYSVYKQPKVKDSDFKNVFETISCKCLDIFKHCVILGDFNVNMINDKNCLADILQLHGQKNIVKQPTCTKGKQPSLIDLVITNVPKCISKVECLDCELSDVHNMVCFSTKAHAPVVKKQYDYIQKLQAF